MMAIILLNLLSRSQMRSLLANSTCLFAFWLLRINTLQRINLLLPDLLVQYNSTLRWLSVHLYKSIKHLLDIAHLMCVATGF